MINTGEFELIGRISESVRDSVPEGVTGIGDDCAVIPQQSGRDTLVTTDLLVEGRHFLLPGISPGELGWKSAAVNISDIAAMGGRPESAFLSIALPGGFGPEWVDEFIAGFRELAGRFGVALLGGDTSASDDKLFINVTLLGSCEGGKALKRSGALPGDLVCVTGTLGDSGAGLRLVLEQASGAASAESGIARYLLRRHCKPEPRVAEGLALAGIPGVHSMMDVSDGIASDLRHILDASGGLGAEIETGSLPLSGELLEICRERGWEAARLALCAGEDYELLFTIDPEALGSVQAALDAAGGAGATVIGRITEAGTPLCWKGWEGEPPRGFTHF